MDWIQLVPIGSPVVLALLFAWFALELFNRFDKSQQTRDEKFLAAQRDRDALFLKAFSDNETANREFLRNERTHRSESTARMAEEIKSLALIIERMSTILAAHDNNMNAAVSAMRERTKTADEFRNKKPNE